MPSIRFIAAGALVSVITVSSALAQTATNAGTGKPIQLLQILTQPDKAKTKVHAKRVFKIKTARKRTDKRRSLVARERSMHVAEAAKAAIPAAAPAPVWPDPTPVPPPGNLVTAEPVPQPAPAATESMPNELVVGGQTVHVVAADDANEIDRAADAQTAPSAAATRNVVAVAQPAADTATVARAHEESRLGSGSWIAQVLAALGGAAAAGSAAWFLMGSTPQRTYG